MQAPTTVPGSSFTTDKANVTKSQEQILIQSSGAMVAVIVLGVIIILAILLIILKTYNKHTHVSRMLGTSKSRQKLSSASTAVTQPTYTAAGNPEISSVSGSVVHRYGSTLENGFHAAELSDTQLNDIEMFSTHSGSTVVTIHDPMSLENT
ncbi:noncompact myelin-associated protein [Gadus chalcogrammus]|uniref:noncompact myelin-associated protein n=1 Tax=Gadus chalcogrammus TaxID=1042646 RepID=UPI0024C3051F|nr:noncompact myelin-associated protein [Gadus chalcogrammus]